MKFFIIVLVTILALTGCAGHILKQGKQAFNQGNYSAAMEKLTPLAEKGDPAAQYAVGYMYYYGQGVSTNKSLGEIWIGKAADQGLPEALQAQQAIHKQQATLNPLVTP